MAAHYLIRSTSLADLPALAALEQEAFSDPWTTGQLRAALTGAGGVGWVATVPKAPGQVVGHLLGRVIVDQGEVLSLAVHPDQRRRGIGAALLDHALTAMAADGVTGVWLEVRVSNLGAQALYQSRLFTPQGRRPRYYQDPVEDALILGRDLTRPAL